MFLSGSWVSSLVAALASNPTILLASFVSFAALSACGGSGDARDGGRDSGAVADAVVDALARDAVVDATVDAMDSRDSGSEPGECACPAFERCSDDGCVCDDAALCGTRGHAGFPMVVPAARELAVDGDVVLDAVTSLVWQRESVAARPWAEARAYCDALVSGGRDDWRLPARVELASILDASRTPSFDADVFVGAADYVWTASRIAGTELAAYAIYFGQGETVSAGVDVGGGHVRCVAGARGSVPRGEVEGDVAVHGGLRWERAVTEASSYADAVDACASRGARLPTLYELHDLVDEARTRPAIDRVLFPETPSARFWSSTERDFGVVVQWVVDFADGQSAWIERGETAHARCVRE